MAFKPISTLLQYVGAVLFGGVRVAASAAILLNVTLMVAVGTLIVTPDAPLLVASSFVLFFLAKLVESGRGAWWLAVGAAVGCALDRAPAHHRRGLGYAPVDDPAPRFNSRAMRG